MSPGFFRKLDLSIRKLGQWPVILGGDWNCTFSSDPVTDNIDCRNMAQLPNARHSGLLHELCTNHNLTDPYRLFFPGRKDFSFCPKNALQLNRSRIDFFIISTPLFGACSSCDIAPAMQNSLFDHKAVKLNFNSKPVKKKGNPTIAREIVNDADLELVVKLAAAECYAIHNVNEAWLPDEKDNLLLGIGINRTNLKLAGPSQKYLPISDLDFEQVQARSEAIDNIRTFVESINFNRLEEMPRTCDHDIFMEILLNCMKNDTISYQTFVTKVKKEKINQLVNNLTHKKSLANPCTDKISLLESQLNAHWDGEISREIENYSLFEHINMEKMTPHFLKIAKCTKPDTKLTDIKTDDNNDFSSEEAQKEFIVKYYENLYKLPADQDNNLTGCIEEFLGEDILASPLTKSMKISRETATFLDRDISIFELDKAANETKLRTASGPDGISNCFIKKFWHLLRTPLTKYANFCVGTGRLSQSFLTASIKLIPKKGDCTKIKNWRPISLLNCIYKIISKSINNRLKTIVDTVTSRAQKGFTQSRYIQEVLINICHTISHCNSSGTPAFVLSLDQRKAFDSVRHDFMLEVYKFFGLGDQFCRMLNLITSGRNATIMFDDCSLSRNFKLSTGAPQGNSPSPLQYNFCEQIAILKIELDPRISSVYQHLVVPRPYPVRAHNGAGDGGIVLAPDPDIGPVLDPVVVPAPAPNIAPDPFRLESNRETDKVESFADDKTVTFCATRVGLDAICKILRDFSKISGLFCNMDKSVIMYVGDGDPAPAYLGEYDFKLVDRITILGMHIDKGLNNLSDCHIATVEKVTKIINFWNRFHLSLPGRINISKTLILSQISYLGSIITPSDPTLRTLRGNIEKFIVGGLNIAKDRIYRPQSLGGLGMIDIGEFITAQQVNWFKRADCSTRDNWRVDLQKLGHGNVLTVGKADIQPAVFPIFAFLADSFEKFLKAFNKTNDNFAKSFLLNNPSMSRSRHDRLPVNLNFFSGNIPANEFPLLSKIKLEQILQNGRLASLDNIITNTGIHINLILYLRLQAALYTAGNILGENRATDGSKTSLSNFLKRFKKGSKQIREVITGSRTSGLKLSEIRNVMTIENLAGSGHNPDPVRKKFLSWWGYSFLPMNLREFSFKFFNNSLGLNQRLARYLGGRGEECTFCILANNFGPNLPESFLHLFYECDTTATIMGWFETTYLPELALNTRSDRIKFWFFGVLPDLNDNSNIFILTLAQTFLFSIWRFKLQKRIPSRSNFLLEMFYNLDKILSASRLVREQMAGFDFLLCRNWDTLRHGRG